MKCFESYQNVTYRLKNSKCCWENGTQQTCLTKGCHKYSFVKKKKAVSVKCNKAKHSKTKSAYMSLEKMSIHILCPLLDGLFVFDFAVELYDLYINLSDI